jgi:hypothetical protein
MNTKAVAVECKTSISDDGKIGHRVNIYEGETNEGNPKLIVSAWGQTSREDVARMALRNLRRLADHAEQQLIAAEILPRTT